MMASSRWITSILCITLTTFTLETIEGAAGKLDRPSIAMSRDVPDAVQKQIIKIIHKKDCKFIEGSWINSSTQIHYQSDTKALGLFLDELSKCPSITLSIGFYKQGVDAKWAPEKSNWSLFHLAGDNRFNIRIRLNSDIDLSKLHLPELKTGPDPMQKK